jgi:CHASE2 domain-containing sensor protein
MFVLIWFLDIIRINFHFLNPFNETIRDYEITDIVYSRLRSKKNLEIDHRIVLVNSGYPASRDTLRMMTDRIAAAGAKVIAFDIRFEEQKDPRIDSMFRQSLLQIENVVLANKVADLEKDEKTFRRQEGCDTFFSNYINTGFINFVDNDSSTIRYISPREMTEEEECLSFASRVVSMYDPAAAERLFKRNNEVEEIFYSGDQDLFVQLSIHDILHTKPDLRDKIVLIGFVPMDEANRPIVDMHYTPLNFRYTGHNTPDMYGMVIHANIIKMMLDNTYVIELSFWVNLLLTFIFCYFNIHLFYQIYRRVSLPFQFITRFLQLGEIILLFFIVASLFHFYRLKMEVAYWITALLLTFDAVKFYDNGIRKRIKLLERIPYVLPASRKHPRRIEKPIEVPQEPKPIEEKTSDKQENPKS